MSKELSYGKISTLDKIFIPAAFVVSGYFLNEFQKALGKYRYHDFIDTYRDQIEKLHLCDSQLLKQKIVNTVLDVGPLSALHFSMAMIFLYMGVACIYNYRADIKPIKVHHTQFIDEVELMLDTYLSKDGSLAIKNGLLLRYTQLSQDDKNTLLDKIKLELGYASIEMEREKKMLSSKIFLEMLSEEDKVVMAKRIDKNHNKLYIYPELLAFLEQISKGEVQPLDQRGFMLDFIRQMIGRKSNEGEVS